MKSVEGGRAVEAVGSDLFYDPLTTEGAHLTDIIKGQRKL